MMSEEGKSFAEAGGGGSSGLVDYSDYGRFSGGWKDYCHWFPCVCICLVTSLIVIIILGAANGDVHYPGDKEEEPFNCFKAPNVPADRRVNGAEHLKIATFNAYYLFLHGTGGVESFCPGKFPCPWANQQIAQEHLGKIAEVIMEIDVDIVVLQEVEDCNVLRLLNSKIQSLDYRVYLMRGTDSEGKNIGFLTRVDPEVDLMRVAAQRPFPLPGSKCGYIGPNEETTIATNFFARFTINSIGGPVKISMGGLQLVPNPKFPEFCAKRETEAALAQFQIQQEVNAGRHVVVLGDMNDYDPNFNDTSADKPIARTLDILRGIITVDLEAEKRNTYTLSNVAQMITGQKLYSAWDLNNETCIDDKPKKLSLLDHILVSPELGKAIDLAHFYHGFPENCSTLVSDHWPIIVEFDFLKL